ncbi:tryptophanase [Flavobacteriaceae bacterium]|jgi:tryptophanase|nr:tryptophanase [Flavobacteriaceae bacterium]MDA0278711.1 tryptophanase [Bacteroidota bacterium]MDA1256188.1 tryptophanase [Pseudomonadota bacterium]MBT4314157.1 tryptophanase [Flavobacteriaceae bacterium]MBT5092495.1 tryptophanase [Flavobacteriaceae bacterium]
MKFLDAEPFRIKVVEPIKKTTRVEREAFIHEADFNVFKLRAEEVYIDMLTDSGTSAMSSAQWAGVMVGDESYAGSKSFFNLRKSVQDIMGFPFVQPTHQGRAADFIMSQLYAKNGGYILGNLHFDSFKGHAEIAGSLPVDMIIEEGRTANSNPHPFKGNMDIKKLEHFIAEHGASQIPLIIITVTSNGNGGQPVSMENIRKVSAIAKAHGIPLMIDAARFAENCYFIKKRELGYKDKTIHEISLELFSYADGCVMSSKKDGLVNIGGFICTRHEELFPTINQLAIINEGFVTYGGMSGRDLEALAIGMYEGIQEDYLEYRIDQVAYLGEQLSKRGVPIILPTGGHGVYVDAQKFYPHIPQSEFPGQAMVIELYKTAGVRGVELGSCAFSKKDPKTGKVIFPDLELVRLTVSRRVYTNRHMDVVVNALADVYERRDQMKGLKLTYEGPIISLRHFTAKFEPLS